MALKVIQSVLHRGIGETANLYDLHAWEVNEIVSKGIQDHQDIIKSHQDTIAQLQKRMEGKEPINECKSGKAKANVSSGNDHDKCYRCRKSGHVASDCDIDYCYVCNKSGHKSSNCSNNVGCYKCGKIGHMSWDCKPVWNEGRGGGVCYYCGMRGYKSVCSLCGETGHLVPHKYGENNQVIMVLSFCPELVNGWHGCCCGGAPICFSTAYYKRGEIYVWNFAVMTDYASLEIVPAPRLQMRKD
ncbi:DNA-binding protein HEXBP [Tanacetum coccineum]